MPHGYVKTPGGWQVASAYYVKVAGVWRPVTNTYVRANGIWKQSFPAAAPPPPPPPPPPPTPPPPTPPPPGGGGGDTTCVSVGFYYCNGSSVVGGGAVCGTSGGAPFGGCTTGSCCSYWQNIYGNPSNWICGASGSVSQPNCGGSNPCGGNNPTGGTCYCTSGDVANTCSPCTNTSQTGLCGSHYTGSQYCGTSYGFSSGPQQDNTCPSGFRRYNTYTFSETSCNYSVADECIAQQGGGCSQTTTGGTCYCSSADISNGCSPCTNTSQSGSCGNYYTGANVNQAASYAYYCTTSVQGAGVGNCSYGSYATSQNASGSGYNTTCSYNNTGTYPGCQSTGSATPPPPPPAALDCVTCVYGTTSESCTAVVAGSIYVPGTRSVCVTNFNCLNTYGPCIANGSTPPPPPPPPICTFMYYYTEYRSSCGGQATITVTTCGETPVCSGATPPPPPPPPAVDCNTCNSYGGSCGQYGNGIWCITPGACQNICQGDYNSNAAVPQGAPTPDLGSGSGYIAPIELPPLDFSGIGKSVNVSTLIRTPDGLVPAGSVEVGDVLLSADIAGFPYEELAGANLAAINWTGKDPDIATVETTVVNVVRRIAPSGVMINNDLFSDTHYVLIKRGAKAMFILSSEVFMEDMVYNYNSSSWETITQLRKADIPHEVVSIDCEPYDVFYTERMLVHDSNTIE